MFLILPFLLISADIFLYSSDADIRDILIAISRATKRNIIVSPDVSGRLSLRVKAPFENIKKILEKAMGISFQEVDGNIVVVPVSKFRSSKIVKLKFYPPKNVIGAISQLGVKASLVHTNLIFLEGEEEKVKIAQRVINEIDKPPKQFLIEARIVEFTLKGAREFGSLLKFISGDFEGNFDFLSGKAQLKISPEKIDYIIGMLEQKGEAKTLSSPKILTTEGEKAEVRQGLSVPYEVTTQFTINTIFTDAFLSLEVVPWMTEENKVVLDVKISKNFPTFEVVSARGVPSISRNEVVSKIVVGEGETVAIGGIIIETNSKSYEGIPFLSSIPVLGFLFRNSKVSEEKREISVFLRPSVVQY